MNEEKTETITEIEIKPELEKSAEEVVWSGSILFEYSKVDQWRERKALTDYCEMLKTGNRKDKKRASDLLKDIKKYST